MEQLWCAFTRVVNGLQHLTGVYGLWNSCGAPSLELSTAYCTLLGCLAYGTAAVRVYARCYGLQHLTRVYGLLHTCERGV